MMTNTPPPGFPDDDDGTEDGGGPPRKVSLAERQAAHEAELAANPPLPTIVLDCKTGTITHIPRCRNCEGDHYGWQCPEIGALLFAPFTDVCVSCGDQLHWDAPLNTVCGACQEWQRQDNERAIIHRMVDRGFAASLV